MTEANQAQADSFSAKLKAFHDSLPQAEQELLGSLIAQGALASDESTTGFDLDSINERPVQYLGLEFLAREQPVSVNYLGGEVKVGIMGW